MKDSESYSNKEIEIKDSITEHEYTDEDELIEMDRFKFDPSQMMLTETDRLDIMRSGKGALTEEERLSRLFNHIRTNNPHEFRKVLSGDRSVINDPFKKTHLLHEACRKGAVDIVTFLLFSNANCSARDSYGLYPQHCAALSAAPVLIDIMSVFGHDLNIKDSKGNTPLHHAVMNRDKTVIHMLLNYKVNILKNDEGNTPIDICNDIEITKTLVEYGDCTE
jgi:Ankyrin repeats (3 copies)/Ankyrin repeat